MHKVVFTTERGQFHQQRALAAAPSEFAITMLREPDRETLRASLHEADYLISERVGVVGAELIAGAVHLKLILRLGSMTHDIDIEAARSAGVIVCRYPDAGTIAVAEHCILQMLALGKKLREVERVALEANPKWGEPKPTDEDTFFYNWSGREGIDRVLNRTVGILGMGEIGAELARRLSTWGCVTLYNKRRRLPERVERELNMSFADLNTLLTQSDYLICLLPYLPETVNYLNAERIARLKPGAMVMSCGSGGTFDEAALTTALLEGRIGGVAVDSYGWEPLRADNPLLALARAGANVLLTPHTAAGAGGARVDDDNRAGEYSNIIRHLRGEPLLYQVV